MGPLRNGVGGKCLAVLLLETSAACSTLQELEQKGSVAREWEGGVGIGSSGSQEDIHGVLLRVWCRWVSRSTGSR